MNRTYFIKFLTFISFFFLLGCDKQEYDIFSTIAGYVSDVESGEPLQSVTVTISPTGKSVLTGADGMFEFDDMDAQQYTVTAQKNGYITNRTRVTALAGETVTVNLTLQSNSEL